MTRVEEIKEKIRKIDEDIFCLPSITDRILMDISISLAIIADSVSREDGEQSEVMMIDISKDKYDEIMSKAKK